MQTALIYDPYEAATPSQRLAAAARNIRLARIAKRAIRAVEITPENRPKPSSAKEATAKFLFSEWLEKQSRINPLPKAPWFSVEKEIEFKVTVKAIQKRCAEFYGVTVLDICAERRTANVVRPRQVAMYLAKNLTTHSLPEISRRFGKRDHTTALHAVRKITNLLLTDPILQEEVETLKNSLLEAVYGPL